MGQEFRINSEAIETKINQLLPSQGGFGAGIDFSASTMIIPTIDLTETATGSALRQDLQSSFSHTTITDFNVTGIATTTIISTTGYYKAIGSIQLEGAGGGTETADLFISDGSTNKSIFSARAVSAVGGINFVPFSINFLLKAGDTFRITASQTAVNVSGSVRQIASLDGTLTNP